MTKSELEIQEFKTLFIFFNVIEIFKNVELLREHLKDCDPDDKDPFKDDFIRRRDIAINLCTEVLSKDKDFDSDNLLEQDYLNGLVTYLFDNIGKITGYIELMKSGYNVTFELDKLYYLLHGKGCILNDYIKSFIEN